jgi:hypothetical protein
MENENNKILIQSNSCSVRNVLCMIPVVLVLNKQNLVLLPCCIMYDPCCTCTQQTILYCHHSIMLCLGYSNELYKGISLSLYNILLMSYCF